jgi:long-chain fatty acid transport protein
MSCRRRLLVVVVLLSSASGAFGSGFAVNEQSARGLGSAHAGEVATAEDASTIFFNPAGLTLLHGTQFVSSGFAIMPSASFENDGSHLSAAGGGGPLRGRDGGDAGVLALLPTFFLAHELTPRVHVGLGVSVPFGLKTGWERGWIGRYHALASSLETVNVNPTIAVRITDWLSIGGGASVEYAKARLTNALDLGSICRIFGAEQGIPPAVCDAAGLAPQRVDGHVKVSGDDWNAGYDLGVMYTPTPRTRVGLAYRSSIHHDLSGTATFMVPRPAAILRRVSGALVDTGARASADLPERASLGAFHEMTSRLAIMADVTWTRWSRFRELRFRFENPAQPTIVEPQRWDDSFRYAIGLRWRPARVLECRLGTAYDESPIPDARTRRPRIPDSDRVWLAAGVAVRPFENLRFDVGYAHLFGLAADGDARDPVTKHVLRGSYTGLGADIVGVQLTYDLAWPPIGAAIEPF